MMGLITFLIRNGMVLSDLAINIWLMAEMTSDSNDLEKVLTKMIEEEQYKSDPFKFVLSPIIEVIQHNLESYQDYMETIKYEMICYRFYMSIISPDTAIDHLSFSELEYALYQKIYEIYILTEEEAANVLYFLSDKNNPPLVFLNPNTDYDREGFDNNEQYALDSIKITCNNKLNDIFEKAKSRKNRKNMLNIGIIAGIGILTYFAFKKK